MPSGLELLGIARRETLDRRRLGAAAATLSITDVQAQEVSGLTRWFVMFNSAWVGVVREKKKSGQEKKSQDLCASSENEK